MTVRARKLVVGNWKMNGAAAQLAEVRALIDALNHAERDAEVVICPPATLIHRVAELAAGSPLGVGAQDAHSEPCGARTGDLGPEMLHDAGARWVILGHSERRTDHRESDDIVRAKVEGALRADLAPIICVGESLEEREAGRAIEVVRAQVAGSTSPSLSGRRFVMAYEPVWAIGSGRTPSVAEIAEVHAAIAETVRSQLSGQAAAVLYGGSVKPENAREILRAPGVDGALVGGASLAAADFLPIIDAATA